MKLSENSGASGETKTKRERWPAKGGKDVRSGSVTVKVYRIWREKLGRHVFNVAWVQPGGGTKTKQRGNESDAMEFARYMADLLAAGKTEAVEVERADLDELREARRRAGDMPLLLALDEWLRARELVGTELIAACEAWRDGKSKFEKISVAETVKRFRDAKGKMRGKRNPKKLLSGSYESHLGAFAEKFGEWYLNDVKASHLDPFITEPKNLWTQGTRRKRLVTLFTWAMRKHHLPQNTMTEADRTEVPDEPASARVLIPTETLARVLALFQYGIDLEHVDRAPIDPRPELVPAVVMSALCGERSSEGHEQSWSDVDFDEDEMNVTRAKEGTASDRHIVVSQAAREWLDLTPRDERTGVIHPYKTEVHTILRAHLERTIGLKLPKNTFRKSWVSYRLKLVKEGMGAVADEAGHTSKIEVKHYRNSKAKTREARAWFSLTPCRLQGYIGALQTGKAKPGTLRQFLAQSMEAEAKAAAASPAAGTAAKTPLEDPADELVRRELMMLRGPGISWSERRERFEALVGEDDESGD